MTVDYPLERLDPRAFEQLTVALCSRVVGRDIETFGRGPDGGREASYSGTINWSNEDDVADRAWTGYVVVQAKQRETLEGPDKDARWLQQQVSRELDSWAADNSSREAIPDYLLFVTNVRLSAVSGGGIDRLNTYIQDRLDRARRAKSAADRLGSIRGWRIWHRDQLTTYLNSYPEIRRSFDGMMTASDVIATVGALHGIGDDGSLASALSRHAIAALQAERWVTFNEAGGAERQSIDAVIVDLPGRVSKFHVAPVLASLLQISGSVLKPSMWSKDSPRHVVISGPPGSGKSTVSRFLTQALRTSFLEFEDLDGAPDKVRTGTQTALARIQCAKPTNRRWPLRVDLAAYGRDLGPSGQKDLLRWMSERVSELGASDIYPAALRKWLESWPSAIVLDGLDEVTAPSVRQNVIDQIAILLQSLDAADADVLVVVTTRPTGFTEQVLPDSFEQWPLEELKVAEALNYGLLVGAIRHGVDTESFKTLATRLAKEAKDPGSARLMRTPLQVLIMSLILERSGALPPDRYRLFWRYFETMLDRECEKPTDIASVIREHRALITDLHEIAGLRLHCRSESATGAEVGLSPAEFAQIVASRLTTVGFGNDQNSEQLASQLRSAITERLVLLIAIEDAAVGFEIRSLQELMAARALSRNTDADLRVRLASISRSPHWRNVWVFVAGQLFSHGPDRHRDLIVELVELADASTPWLTWLMPVAPELASALLDDGLADAFPLWHRRLLTVALRALAEGAPIDLRAVALGLRNAFRSDALRPVVEKALLDASLGLPRQRMVAGALVGTLGVKPRGGDPTAKRLRSVFVTPRSTAILGKTTLGELIDGLDLPQLHSGQPGEALARLIEALRPVYVDLDGPLGDTRVVSRPLAAGDTAIARQFLDPEIGSLLERVFNLLAPEHYRAIDALHDYVAPAVSRLPVDEHAMLEGLDFAR